MKDPKLNSMFTELKVLVIRLNCVTKLKYLNKMWNNLYFHFYILQSYV